MEHYDVAIAGAGFGGMATALQLCREGRSVALFEGPRTWERFTGRPGGVVGGVRTARAIHRASS